MKFSFPKISQIRQSEIFVFNVFNNVRHQKKESKNINDILSKIVFVNSPIEIMKLEIKLNFNRDFTQIKV